MTELLDEVLKEFESDPDFGGASSSGAQNGLATTLATSGLNVAYSYSGGAASILGGPYASTVQHFGHQGFPASQATPPSVAAALALGSQGGRYPLPVTPPGEHRRRALPDDGDPGTSFTRSFDTATAAVTSQAQYNMPHTLTRQGE